MKIFTISIKNNKMLLIENWQKIILKKCFPLNKIERLIISVFSSSVQSDLRVCCRPLSADAVAYTGTAQIRVR